MKMIRPIDITDPKVTFNNVPETEYTDWTSAEAVVIGNERQVIDTAEAATATHMYYTANTNHSGKDPTLIANQGAGNGWDVSGSTNAWEQFDEILQTQTDITVARDDGLTLPGGAGNYASSPDVAFPTEKFTLIAKITPTDATPAAIGTIFSHGTTTADQRSVSVQLDTTGKLKLTVSGDGTAGTEITYLSNDVAGLTDATEGWIKIIFDGDDGANSVADFYASLDITDNKTEAEFTQLGAVVTGAQTAIHNSTSVLELGSANVGTTDLFIGSIQRVVVYEGLTDIVTPIVSDYNRVDIVDTGVSTTASTGQAWTEQGTAALVQDIPGIVADILPGAITNSVGFLGLDGTELQVEVIDPTDGELYNRTVLLTSYSGITDWYSYYYEPITRIGTVTLFDLPAVTTATLRFTVKSNDTEIAKCGEAVFGQTFIIGDSQNGADFSIRDYSIKSTAEDGSVTVTQGAFSDLATVDVHCETARFTEIKKTLTDFRSVPVVWVPTEEVEGTIIYGYYRSFNEVITDGLNSRCLLKIEGLT